MKKIFLVGAGEIGSRHLQALKAVSIPLDITVIDRSQDALSLAKKRFDEATGSTEHSIRFLIDIPKKGLIDLAIIATRSDARREATESLLKNNKVRYFILEKLLFSQKEDYAAVGRMLKKHKSTAWVNCRMREIPFYREMKKEPMRRITYNVLSGKAGLVTNVVHFLDHVAYLTDCLSYTPDLSLLNKKSVPSKREGFLEFTGTIRALFTDGSIFSFTRNESGIELLLTVSSDDATYVVNEDTKRALVSTRAEDPKWREVSSPIPFQSVMTTWLVEEILGKGTCPLVTYEDSVKIHLPILEALRKFLNANGKKQYDYYPFT